MTLQEDFINDVNSFFKDEPPITTIEAAVDKIYAQVDNSPERPMHLTMKELLEKYHDVDYIEKNILDVMRNFKYHKYQDLFKKALLFLGLLEAYKYSKNNTYIPNKSLLDLNVSIMGPGAFISTFTNYEEAQLWLIHGVGLSLLGLNPNNVDNCFQENDEAYNKIYIYLLLSFHLSNDMFQSTRAEALRVLLDGLKKNDPYFYTRAFQVGNLGIYASYHKLYDERVAYREKRGEVYGFSYGANEETRKNRQLALHFANLGMDALVRRMGIMQTGAPAAP